jgi:hypothetical protein
LGSDFGKAITVSGYDGDRLGGGLGLLARSILFYCEVEYGIVTFGSVRVLADV